jgi:hypothetical protein
LSNLIVRVEVFMYDIVIHHSFFVKELLIGSRHNIKITCRPRVGIGHNKVNYNP